MTVVVPSTDMQVRIDINRRDNEMVLFTPWVMAQLCRDLTSRRWDKKTNTWRVPLILPAVEEVVKAFDGHHPIYSESALAMISKLRTTVGEFMAVKDRLDFEPEDTGYKWKTRPRHHQVSGTQATLALDRVGNFDEVGLGKSKETIDAVVERMRRRKISRAVIICPTSLKFMWGGDEARGIEGQIQIHALTDYGQFDNVLVVHGNPKQRAEQFRLAFRKQWIVINYELAKIHLDILRQLTQDQYLICDEAHRLKNQSTQTYKAVRSMKPKYLNLLTGTPVANTPVDVYALSELIQPGLLGSSFGSFARQYVIKGGYEGREVVGFKNLGKLRQAVSTISFRRKASILSDLPPKTYQMREVDMQGDQKKEYLRMRDEMYAFYKDMPETDFILQAPQAITQLLRLQQIADGFIAVADRIPQWFDSQPKLDALDEIVEEVCDREKKKLVVWSRFRPVTSFIEEKYSHLKAVRLAGDVDAKERSRIIHQFKTDPDCRLFVSQVKAGGEGLTLTEANHQVFYDRWWSHSVNYQAEGRLHRIGTKGTVVVFSLACRESIDQNVIRMLADKKKWSDEVTGDEVFKAADSLTKSDVLSLLS